MKNVGKTCHGNRQKITIYNLGNFTDHQPRFASLPYWLSVCAFGSARRINNYIHTAPKTLSRHPAAPEGAFLRAGKLNHVRAASLRRSVSFEAWYTISTLHDWKVKVHMHTTCRTWMCVGRLAFRLFKNTHGGPFFSALARTQPPSGLFRDISIGETERNERCFERTALKAYIVRVCHSTGEQQRTVISGTGKTKKFKQRNKKITLKINHIVLITICLIIYLVN